MKLFIFSWVILLALLGIIPEGRRLLLAQNQLSEETADEALSDFDRAVEIIKKYETLHQPKHWPLVGYGHKVLPGEKFDRTKTMGQKQAEELLRKDLLKNCAVFRSFGADSLLLGVLAYNIGSGATMRSSVVKKLRQGDRDIYDTYVAHSKYKGKTHNQLKNRRIEEFESLFIKDLNETDNGNPLIEETEQSVQIDEVV